MRRARRAEAGLTEVVARRWGGEAARCGGARHRPCRTEGRRQLQLAPGATEEDVRGEGGSKSGNGGGLAGLTVGGDGDGGGRKTCRGGPRWLGRWRGREAACLAFARRRVRERKKRGERGGVGRLSFEWRRGEAGEGGPGVDAA
jgi:hypothetical protein